MVRNLTEQTQNSQIEIYEISYVFQSSLPPVVCRMAHDLLCYLSLFAYSDDEHFGLFYVFMFWKLQLFYNIQNGSTPLNYLI